VKKNVLLILCGSSISMMEQGVLSYKSPFMAGEQASGNWHRSHLKK